MNDAEKLLSEELKGNNTSKKGNINIRITPQFFSPNVSGAGVFSVHNQIGQRIGADLKTMFEVPVFGYNDFISGYPQAFKQIQNVIGDSFNIPLYYPGYSWYFDSIYVLTNKTQKIDIPFVTGTEIYTPQWFTWTNATIPDNTLKVFENGDILLVFVTNINVIGPTQRALSIEVLITSPNIPLVSFYELIQRENPSLKWLKVSYNRIKIPFTETWEILPEQKAIGITFFKYDLFGYVKSDYIDPLTFKTAIDFSTNELGNAFFYPFESFEIPISIPLKDIVMGFPYNYFNHEIILTMKIKF